MRRIRGSIGNLRRIHHGRSAAIRRDAGTEHIVVDFRLAVTDGANFFRHFGDEDGPTNVTAAATAGGLLAVGGQYHGGRSVLVAGAGVTHHFYAMYRSGPNTI